eukprot:SAG25_NODE_4836_length_743_cov_1.335404_1_plen_85_part_10
MGCGGRRECPAAEMCGAAVSAQLAPYLRGTQLAQDRAAAAHGQMEQEQQGVGMEGFRKWFWLEQRGEEGRHLRQVQRAGAVRVRW